MNIYKICLMAGTFLFFNNVNSQDSFLDLTFGNNGIVALEAFTPKVVHRQQDGQILVAGGIEVNVPGGDSESDFVIFRFNADGSADQSFGINGKVHLELPLNNRLVDIIQLPDGRIFGVGSNSIAPDKSSFLFVRLDENGALDTSYGTNGYYQFQTSAKENEPKKMIRLQDGRIAVAGTRFTPPPGMGNYPLGTLVVLNTNQNLDLTFNGTGYRFVPSILGYHAITSDSEGTIISGNNGSVTKYLVNGMHDSTFGVAGQSNVDFGLGSMQWMRDIDLKANGKMLISGRRFYNNSYHGLLIQLTAAGNIDSDYGNNGFYYPADSSGVNENILQTLLLDNGDAVSLTQHGTAENYNYRLLFTTNSGTINPSVGNSGEIVTLSNGSLEITSITMDSNGKLLAVGYDSEGVTLMRYTPTAVLGTQSFAGSAITIYPNPADDFVNVAGLDSGTTLTLYNVAGQMLLRATANRETTLDISGFPQGMYFIRAGDRFAKIIKE